MQTQNGRLLFLRFPSVTHGKRQHPAVRFCCPKLLWALTSPLGSLSPSYWKEEKTIRQSFFVGRLTRIYDVSKSADDLGRAASMISWPRMLITPAPHQGRSTQRLWLAEVMVTANVVALFTNKTVIFFQFLNPVLLCGDPRVSWGQFWDTGGWEG